VTKEEGTLKQNNTSVDRNISNSIGTAMSNLKNSKLIKLLHPIASPLPINQNSKLIQLPHHTAFTTWPFARSCTTIVHAEQ
jgi:hypothetical protein